MPDFRFLTLKAFGDFIIAYSSLRGRVDCSTHLIGEHLLELATAVDSKWKPTCLAHGERTVPAVFDVKKRGVVAAIRSLVSVRNAIAELPRNSVLIFDRLTRREKLLAAGRPALCLPQAPNIYLAYEAMLNSISAPQPPLRSTNLVNRGNNKVRIFAGSRIDAKKLPIALCTALVEELSRLGEEAELVALENEYPELESTDLPKLILPKGFRGMAESVATSKWVISADSLPAHLAELDGLKPVVVSPIDNSYWLPRSSFDSKAWSLFEQGVPGILGALERSTR